MVLNSLPAQRSTSSAKPNLAKAENSQNSEILRYPCVSPSSMPQLFPEAVRYPTLEKSDIEDYAVSLAFAKDPISRPLLGRSRAIFRWRSETSESRNLRFLDYCRVNVIRRIVTLRTCMHGFYGCSTGPTHTSVLAIASCDKAEERGDRSTSKFCNVMMVL